MKVVTQTSNRVSRFILVDYFPSIKEAWNTHCSDIRFMRSKSSVGVWKIKKLKN